MPEIADLCIGVCALIPSFLYSFFYALGGRDQAPLFSPRVWKRLIAPISFSVLVLLFSKLTGVFNPWMLFLLITFPGAHFLIKYGGENIWVKIKGRILAGIIISLAALPIALFARSYTLWLIQMIWAVLAHTTLGLTNPVKAPQEEFLISFLTVIFIPFMVI